MSKNLKLSKLSIKGIMYGTLIFVVGYFVLGTIFLMILAAFNHLFQLPQTEFKPHLDVIASSSDVIFCLEAISCLFALIGGYITAKFSENYKSINALLAYTLIIIIGTLMPHKQNLGIVLIILVDILLLLAYLGGAYLESLSSPKIL